MDNNFYYGQHRPLFRLVIWEASNSDMWNNVFDLVQFISQTTPPTSIPPMFDGTPVIYSSASMQGEEQTRRLLEKSLFGEIKNCTYWSVDGLPTTSERWETKEFYNVISEEQHVTCCCMRLNP